MECVSICNQHLCSCGNSTKKHFTSVKFKMADFFSTVKLKAKSANTLKSYKGKETRFLNWLSSEEPSCWDEGVPEVIIERITSGMTCSFISEESQWPDRSMKKFGTAESINNALVYYHQKKKCRMPDDYLSEWITKSRLGFCRRQDQIN